MILATAFLAIAAISTVAAIMIRRARRSRGAPTLARLTADRPLLLRLLTLAAAITLAVPLTAGTAPTLVPGTTTITDGGISGDDAHFATLTVDGAVTTGDPKNNCDAIVYNATGTYTATSPRGVNLATSTDVFALLNTITALSAYANGLKICLTSGSFTGSTSWAVSLGNVNIVGTGLFATTLIYSGTGYAVNITPANGQTRLQDFRMEDLTLQGQTALAGRNLVNIQGGQRLLIHNVLLRKCGDVCLNVDSSDAAKPTRGGIYYDQIMCESFIGDCFRGTGSAVNPEMHFHQIRVDGSSSLNGTGFNFPNNGLLWLDDIDIANFGINGQGGYGFNLQNQFHTYLSNLWVEKCDTNIAGGNRVEITGSHFTSMNRDGLQLVGATYFTLTANAFVNNGQNATNQYDGVALLNSQYNTLVANTAYNTNGASGPQRYGVSETPSSDYNTFSSNTLLSNANSAGILKQGSHSTSHNNQGASETAWSNLTTSTSVYITNTLGGGDPWFNSASAGGQNLDLHGSLRPSTDNSYQLGDSNHRYFAVHSQTFKTWASASDANPTTNLSSGKLALGPGGAGAMDVCLQRGGAGLLSMCPGSSLKIDGTYNGGHLLLAGDHFWIDANGQLRQATGTPSSDLDGFVMTREVGAPATHTSPCTLGDIALGATYLYICTATNNWIRIAYTDTTW